VLQGNCRIRFQVPFDHLQSGREKVSTKRYSRGEKDPTYDIKDWAGNLEDQTSSIHFLRDEDTISSMLESRCFDLEWDMALDP
jgi:hypothetical protein